MKKVGFISLGCPKNLVDSEVMMGQLKANGYELTANASEADTVVVNTCGFIDSAKKESIEAILEAAQLKTNGQATRLVVAGCLVERYRDELKASMPEVDAFIGTSQINDILAVCDPQTNTRSLPVIALGNQSATYLYDESTPRVLATPYPFEIIQAPPGQITVVHELNHQIRVVAMDKPMPSDKELIPFPYYNGHSVGRFEGVAARQLKHAHRNGVAQADCVGNSS